MLKIFRNFGIVVFAMFSFFYTDRIASLTLENNEIYKTIKDNASDYEVMAVDASIDGDYITPGLFGRKVALKTSYFNMKDINTFNSYYLVYDDTYPNVSVISNKDKIINKGNSLKRSVSFVIEYNSEVIKFFTDRNIDVSVLIDLNSFSRDAVYEQINNDYKNYKNLDSMINKYSTNSNVCYVSSSIESICRSNNKFLVKTEKVINNVTFKDIKNNIESGDIYYVTRDIDVRNLNLIINSILYKDLDIVRLSKIISEERD